MTTTLIKIESRKRSCAFTLTEMIISVGIFGVVMASILSSFLVFTKSSLSVGNYAAMSEESRGALEMFSRDIRAAEGLVVLNPQVEDGVVYSTSGIQLTYPSYHGARSISYEFGDGVFRRTETQNGNSTTREMLTHVNHLKFKFFQAPGATFSAVSGPVASVNHWAKSIQLDAELLRRVISVDNSDYIMSARFMMRN